MNEITTVGMVLSIMPIGEYDRRIELLTTDLGRISAFARGARKPGSALVSATRVFAFGTFKLARGKSAYNVRSAAVSQYFEELTTDLDLTYYGFYFLELAQYFSRENVPAEDMLKLLYYSLTALYRTTIPHRLIRSIYELKMLDLSGLCPEQDRIYAGAGIPAGETLSGGCLKAYNWVKHSPPEKLFSFKLSEDVLAEFEHLVGRLLALHVDRKFKSLDRRL